MDRKPLNRSTSTLIGLITSGTSPHMQTLVFLILRLAVPHAWNCDHPCLLPPPLVVSTALRTCRVRTVWPIFVFYGSKDVCPRNLRPFQDANKKFNIFHYFPPSGWLPTKQILILIGTVGAFPRIGEILPICDFFDCLFPTVLSFISRSCAQVEPLNRFSRFMAAQTVKRRVSA